MQSICNACKSSILNPPSPAEQAQFLNLKKAKQQAFDPFLETLEEQRHCSSPAVTLF